MRWARWAAVGGLAFGLAACGRPGPPPDVVIVTLDTVRASLLDPYGSPYAATPTLRGFAEEAVRFDRAYTVTPLTIPAHSSLHTGYLPPRHGVRDNGDFTLGEEARTLAELARERGYATGASVGAEVTSHHWGFAQGFDAYHDDMGEQDRDNRWRVERPGSEVVDDALRWVAGVPAERPVLLWVHLFDAHHPYAPPEPFRSRFAQTPYVGELAEVDRQVGRLLDGLRAHGRYDESWIIVLADHGEGLGDHGESMHGVLLHDGTMRIPLLVRAPGGRRARAADGAPASLVDVLPTVAEVLGVDAPATDGESLVARVREGRAPASPRQLYLESLYGYRHYGWAQQLGLVTPTHKLISSTTPELYAADDVREARDLSRSEPALLAQLSDELRAWSERMAPVPNASAPAAASAERMKQLEALGYMSAVATPADGPLPDPKAQLPQLARLDGMRQSLQRGDLDAARREAEAVLALSPGLVEATFVLAQVLARQGETELAVALLEAEDARAPSASARAMLGAIALGRGEAAVAEGRFDAALQLDPYLVSAEVGRLHAIFMGGELPRFAVAAQAAAARVPESDELAGLAGLGAVLEGRAAEGEVSLRRALERETAQPFLHFGLALALRERGDAAGAEAELLEELAWNGAALPARRMLATMYAEQARYEEQLAQLVEIDARAPNDRATLHALAQAAYNLGRYEEADRALDRCLALDPGFPAALMLRANVRHRQGREPEARAAYEAALEAARERTNVDTPGEAPAAGGASAAKPGGAG